MQHVIQQILTAILAVVPSDSGALSLYADFRATAAFRPVGEWVPADLGRFESYSGNWEARRLDPEAARRWQDLPAMGQVDLRVRMDSLVLFSSLPLRRDVEAWRRDPSGANAVLSVSELDINVPYEGWASWRSGSGIGLKAGRFRQSYSPSPYGVILGSDLVHDAIRLEIPMGRWRFDWFFSSLDPWLGGVRGDGTLQSGSETALQRTRTISNQRGRIYDESYKSLFLHRLGCRLGDWELSIAEVLLVGGKAPQWRDAVPFMVWHDNYGDGYSKVSTAVQAVWNPGVVGRFHLQGLFEDVQVPVGEEYGGDPRMIYGSNLGWKGVWNAPTGSWSSSVDLTIASATLNNHRVPLLKGVSRRLYRSNAREQDEPGFVDTWVVDQPLAYRRGSDAVDLWAHLDWMASDSGKGAGLEVDWLNQGDARVWEDAADFQHRSGPLSGAVTTQYRFLASAWFRFAGRVRLDAGAGVVLVDAPARKDLSVQPDLSASATVGF